MNDLIGMATKDGWHVESAASFPADQTGGKFSSCFNVSRKGQRAFLKALNLDIFDIRSLTKYMTEFEYEQQTLEICRDNRMHRVVRLIESGELTRASSFSPIQRTVPFVVFELADGDIRSSVDVSKDVLDSWRLTVLHQTALGLMQLHGAQIAHQDLKPSNVLLFPNGELKVGDLGRATHRARPAPHDVDAISGGIKYAPFEQMYDYRAPGEWAQLRISYDVFNLGTFLVFIFTSNVLPSIVLSTIEPQYHPKNWGGTYAEVQPILQAHLVKTVHEIAGDLPIRFRDELTRMILDLCHVDPLQRGRLGSKTGRPDTGPLWLQKYVSRFDVLRKQAVLQEQISNARRI